ncbi:MAG: hypothetical protein AB1402_06850 [Bacillota bacterium]
MALTVSWSRIRAFLTRVLLIPLLPLLGWGPATHPLLNKWALERAHAERKRGNKKINGEILARLSAHRETYMFAGNSTDVISLDHLKSGGKSIYDYAHNYYPDHAGGSPVFGYQLIDEWREAALGHREITYPERDFAVACGWLSHQLADWYAHYAPIDRQGRLVSETGAAPDGHAVFSGYSNAHRALGAWFLPEILHRYRLIDHALIEFAHDFLLLVGAEPLRRHNRVELFHTYSADGKRRNLLTAASERYQGVTARIWPENVDAWKKDFNSLIRGQLVFVELLLHRNPWLAETVRRSLDPAETGQPDYLELCVAKIVDELFCKSFAEISELARRSECRPGGSTPAVEIREFGRSGTVLFEIFRRVGEYVSPELTRRLTRCEDGANLRLLWGLVDVRACLVRELARHGAARGFWGLAQSVYPDPALWGFLEELMRGADDLEAPRERFRRALQPVVELAGPANLNEEERLRRMLEAGELRVQIVPGIALDRPLPEKEINPVTVRFWINNYPVSDLARFFELDSGWDGFRLMLRCLVREPLCSGRHYLYVDAADNAGTEARALRREIGIGGGWRQRNSAPEPE